MWDELSAAAIVDPSIITSQKELYVDINIDHGPSYGATLFWEPGTELPSYERLASVQFDVDAQKLYDVYVKLMTRPPRQAQ
jgi:inosine-uridine nucleoside N-ribohydrolase